MSWSPRFISWFTQPALLPLLLTGYHPLARSPNCGTAPCVDFQQHKWDAAESIEQHK